MNFIKIFAVNVTKTQNIFYNSIRLNSFNSAISLRNLYPSSSLRLTNITKAPENEKEFNGYIPLDQIEITYIDVRFHVKSATWINEEIKDKLLKKCQNQISKEGCLIFRSDLTRHQQLNLADCLEKIRTLIRNCSQNVSQPSEETIDKIRRRHERAAQERLAIKRTRSQIKSERSGNIIV
ncbi:hypothetical protein HHI36_014956 [Cryptolaemus montrouzieri]|uniref:Peptidyl-tRNA hydrolase ICT1, mitochondrial n=1 Tax=Cryptolaemus montrouzieri TaxID=559131 RepID=A0ABD2N457_9CUCU